MSLAFREPQGSEGLKEMVVFWSAELRARRKMTNGRGAFCEKGMADGLRGLIPRIFRSLVSRLSFPFLFCNSFEASSVPEE